MSLNTVVVQTAETTGEAPADHNQKMIDKANGVTAVADPETPPAGERPAWLPEKFKTPEEMAASYAALESKLGAPVAPPVEAPVEPVVPSSESLEIEAKAVDDVLAKSNLSLSEFSQEFDAKGELSEASYTKLLTAGFDKTLVDNYIAGQQARASLHQAELKNSVGGDQAYTEMTQWAAATMTPSEINAYNASVSSSNIDAAKLAMAGLKARYTASNGKEPTFVKAVGAATVADQFNSNQEVKQAMKDPRYARDSAYRNSVAQKIARSPNVL